MDIQISANPCTVPPVPPVLTTNPEADDIQPYAECPSPSQQTPKPSIGQLITEAAKLLKAGEKDRVALGKLLIEIHAATARRGNGSFQKACIAIGFKKNRAYDYMHEAGWQGPPKKQKRRVRKNTPPSTHVARRGKFVELSFEANELQAKNMSKAMKENPSCVARLIHETIRVYSVLQNEAAVMAAIQDAVNRMSLLNAG